jgi:hypothetical protein
MNKLSENILLSDQFYAVISKIFRLGPYTTSWLIPNEVELISFNKSDNKYINVIYDSTNITNYSKLTHYIVTSYPITNNDILQTASGWSLSSGKSLILIPPYCTSIDQVLNVINKASIVDQQVIPPVDTGIMDINKRFELLASLTRMVGEGKLPGMVISGSAGVGKTYTVIHTLSSMGLVEDKDYKYYKGAKLTTVAFYEAMYDNKDKLIVFDDSDSILMNPDTVNMLKSALDSDGKRTIEYYSSIVDSHDLPNKFLFTGHAIFISNVSMDNIDPAVKSRCLIIDLTMTRSEVLDRMAAIVAKGAPAGSSFTTETFNKAFDYLKWYINDGPGVSTGRPYDMNMRTIVKLATVLQANPDKFDDLANYILTLG